MESNDFTYDFLIIYQDGNKLIKEIPSGNWNVVIIVCSGILEMKIDGSLMELDAQYCMMISKNVLSEISSTSKKIKYFQIGFTSEFFFEFIDFSPRIFIEFFVARNQLVFKIDNEFFEDIILILNLLNKNFEAPHDIFYSKIIQYNFGLLLMELTGSYYQNKTKDSYNWRTKRIQLVTGFYQMIEKNVREEHFVEFYAGKLNVTPAHLGRVVKEVTGKSAREIIDEFLVFEAKRLLRVNELSISQVGNQLGFSSLSFFSYYFKKHTGLSPHKFRSDP